VSWRFEEGKIKAGEREDIYHDGTLDVDVASSCGARRPR
jgi:hypothetical protein